MFFKLLGLAESPKAFKKKNKEISDLFLDNPN